MQARTVFLALALLSALPAGQPQAATLALTHITIVDGMSATPAHDMMVLIRNGRISGISSDGRLAIPPGAEVINGAGKYLIPGLADMHNHLGSGLPGAPGKPLENLARLLSLGVTTVFCPGSTMEDYREIKTAVAADPLKYPHFYSAGNAFTVEGGHPPGAGTLRPGSPEEARNGVRTMKTDGVDAIKLIVDAKTFSGLPAMAVMKPEIYAAIIDEAHKAGLKALVHAPMMQYAKAALRSGADGLIHGVVTDHVDAEFLELMKKNHAFYMSTSSIFQDAAGTAAWTSRLAALDDRGVWPASSYALFRKPAVFEQIHSRLGLLPKDNLDSLRWNLKAVQAAGIPIVTGTDTGVPGVLLGISSLMELVLHVEAGLTPRETLRAATYEAQHMMGQEREAGTVEVGKIADLVMLDANPLEDIRNVRRVNRVIREGVVTVVRVSALASAEVPAEREYLNATRLDEPGYRLK